MGEWYRFAVAGLVFFLLNAAHSAWSQENTAVEDEPVVDRIIPTPKKKKAPALTEDEPDAMLARIKSKTPPQFNDAVERLVVV